MAGHDAERFGGNIGHSGESDQGCAQSAVSHRRSIGYETNHGRKKRIKPQADKDSAADSHWSATPGRSFQKSPKRKANQDRLNPRVGRQIRHRAAYRDEVPRLNGDVVK